MGTSFKPISLWRPSRNTQRPNQDLENLIIMLVEEEEGLTDTVRGPLDEGFSAVASDDARVSRRSRRCGDHDAG